MIQTPEEFVALRTSENREEYSRAAQVEAPDEVWREVIERFPDMRKWVAHNKTVSVAILDVLSRDPDPDVRWHVAQKRKAGIEILRRLAIDADEGVRDRVAWNAKTPLAILQQLAQDPSPNVANSARDRLRRRFGIEPDEAVAT